MAINSVNELWNKIYEDCQKNERISAVGFKMWIDDLVPLTTDDGFLTLVTNSEYKKNAIDSYYKKIFEDVCEIVSGLPMKVNVVVHAETPKEPEKKPEERYTFDNFVVGSSNKFAHAAALAVAKNPSSNLYNPLFIYGNSGLGKTHLMGAIINYIKINHPDKTILYLTGENFANDLVEAIRNQTTDLFRNRFRSVDVLLIDDIHFIAGKDYAQEEFFNTFNALYPHKQIIVTSDRPPKEIKTLEERIRYRFESGILADMAPPDFETRMCILKNKADSLGLSVDDDVLYYVAEQIKDNIRQLEGIIKKLHASASVNSNISLLLVQNYIRDVISETLPEPITVEKIVNEVSRTYDIPPEDIFSKKKTADIAKARQISIYIVSRVMELSSVDIGKKFNKDHTTVLYTVEKIKNLIKNNESEKRLIDDIIKNIKSL